MLSRNELITIAYPQSTDVGASNLIFQTRTFRVRGVRDLVTNPLSVNEFLRRPMVRRSRYLFDVWDVDRQTFRKIYYRNAQEWFRETPLRVGLYDRSGLVELLAPNWGPTVRDRIHLVKFLGRLSDRNLGEMRLGVFSDDLEVIR